MSTERYREQHKKRLSWMPWLYFTLKPAHREWAEAWQREVQSYLRDMETVELGEGCFIAPEAAIFGEQRRPIRIGNRCAIAADVFMHGPIVLGDEVSINARANLDGGSKGIQIGEGTRIASGACLYAFNHGIRPDKPIREQPVHSSGIIVGKDCWISARAGITDGVRVGDHAVVAMGAVVTRNVPDWAIVAGVPARVIAFRDPTQARPESFEDPPAGS